MMYKTTEAQMVHVYEIATAMAKDGLSPSFITNTVDLARRYEGAYELMMIWSDERDEAQKDQALADIQELLDEKAEKASRIEEEPKLTFDRLDDKLDDIGSRILAFKAELRRKVDRWGGISQLARVTGMPQSLLSRFFNSVSMPRRITLYRIAKALDLPED